MQMDMSVPHIEKDRRMPKLVKAKRHGYKRDGEYLLLYDNQERIDQCLNCVRPECVNCYVTIRRRKQRSTTLEKTASIREAYYRAYITGRSDLEIGLLINRSQATAHRYRLGLGLPAPSKNSREEKEKIIEELKNEVQSKEASRDSA